MNHEQPLDDRGHAVALGAVALLALALSGAILLDGGAQAHAAASGYTDAVAAGVLVYRLPVIDVVARRDDADDDTADTQCTARNA